MSFKNIIKRRLQLSLDNENNENCDKMTTRKHTDFSIKNILSSSEIDLSSKKVNEVVEFEKKDYRPLNKAFPSPWNYFKGPIDYRPEYKKDYLPKDDYVIVNLEQNLSHEEGVLQNYQNNIFNNFYYKPNTYNHNYYYNEKLNTEINYSTTAIASCSESFKCKICEKVFGCSITLQTHEKSHRAPPRYECEECGKGFSQLRNFKYHVSVHRGTKEFAAKCPECDKVFNDKGYLSSHLKIHRNRKEYVCPHCPKSFNQRVAFNMHVRIHTGIKPHKCLECGKKFSRKMLLKQHTRTHSGEKPYQCVVCGKTFADRSNMTLHHRLHSGLFYF